MEIKSYNLSTVKDCRAGSAIVQVRYFSAEAALNLLVEAGVRKIRCFVAPFVQIDNRRGGSLIDLGRRLRALARATYRHVGLYELERRIRNRLSR